MNDKIKKPSLGVPEYLKKNKPSLPAKSLPPKKVAKNGKPTLLFYMIAFLFFLYVGLTVYVLFVNS